MSDSRSMIDGQGGYVGPEAVKVFQMITALHGLAGELKGFRVSHVSCYAWIKRNFKLKGNRKRVHDQFAVLLAEEKARWVQHVDGNYYRCVLDSDPVVLDAEA